MKLVKSVFRGPIGERVFDPAEGYVNQFSRVLLHVNDPAVADPEGKS